MTENVDEQSPKYIQPDFENTEIAFRGKSDQEVHDSYRLFKLINNRLFFKIGPYLANIALKIGLPVSNLIRKTLFKQFCGGESIEECEPVIKSLAEEKVGTILDYAVEGSQDESGYSSITAEIIKTIKKAGSDDRVTLTVFKPSGLARVELLEKVSAGKELTASEVAEYFRVKGRINNICKSAYDLEVSVMIDAEESWTQNAVDQLALEMMQLYNLEQAVVYNTYQLYKKNGLTTLKAHYVHAETHGFILGAKLVRGAYLEKEENRALALEYESPVHTTKEATDNDYNAALKFCVQHIKYIGLVAGTHNEESCKILIQLLKNASVPVNHPHVYFSQLLGMSDNLSFNLAHAGYNVAKYVPYGPVKLVLPYLFRRAEENSAIAGQMSRELMLLSMEKQRRIKR